jgi:hypothetical protein
MGDGSKRGPDVVASGENPDTGAEPIDHAKRLAQFVERFQSLRITSTAAAIVTFSGTLYNVESSTDDPKIDGLKWKPLLITLSAGSTGCKITQACYADTPAAPGTSAHPGFDVGGHMTTNSNGTVATGGSCYLMPLCAWHNNPARDRTAFTHANTCMVQLAGYMQAEPFETFFARLDGAAPAAIVYVGAEGLESRLLGDPARATAKVLAFARSAEDSLPESFVILERVEEDGETFYRIADSRTAG